MNRLIFLFMLLGLVLPAMSVERFPPPDFQETGHEVPSDDQITSVRPRAALMPYVDAAVMAVFLVLSGYFLLKLRSRKMVFVLMLFAMLYFGFYKKGCVCSVGSIQNITYGFFNSGYAASIPIILFFALPLIAALFFGRIFCGSVCPLGAIQDFVLLRPIKIPMWLEELLRLIAYIYLASALLFAATGAAFLICREDPFIAFYRFSGQFKMVVISICFLIAAMFIGRPYCRFLCPYGILLRNISRFTKWKVSITPDECINCRLCEDACPFNAIEKPTGKWPGHSSKSARIALVCSVIALPVIAMLFGISGRKIGENWAMGHPTVSLASDVRKENNNPGMEISEASMAFRGRGGDMEKLFEQAADIRGRFVFGGLLAGLFVGAVAGGKLIKTCIRFERTEYTANPAGCLSCGRCYKYCPREHAGHGKANGSETLLAGSKSADG
ncbi:Putative electron transport protein YccM [Limihaloglobus sulfuriphilus]|uniref:Putative electron transport protein YccM n=1 Tax=Limihaloglobus sulfuriphilus TaxID=1851148 RepID=A0A1Q2MB60_9BACT|nr:4Fe-4S binding protein [Limihaloglobus sulfuriphilus]AQQ69768.1 Putative electron transport protein YccM [Limihaloglobus sulfuriphilus]